MSARFAERDRVAIRDRVDEPYRLGTVTGLTALGYVVARLDGGSDVAIRPSGDPRVVLVDDVPVDERHWVPERVRDQLVRQEAAAKVRALGAAMPACLTAAYVLVGAEQLNNLLDSDPAWLAAARALLTPTNEPPAAVTAPAAGAPARLDNLAASAAVGDDLGEAWLEWIGAPGACCGALARGYGCLRPASHSGQHVATSGRHVVAVWPHADELIVVDPTQP